MGLFTKKFDLEKDGLVIRFDLNEMKYNGYMLDGRLIDYHSLSRKSKKILDKKNKMLNKDPNLLEKEITSDKEFKRFKELQQIGYTCDGFQVLTPLNGSMSKEMEEYLTRLTSEENVLLGIHRVGTLSQEKIENILVNGIMITGHTNSGSNNERSLSNNVSYYPNNRTIIKELMHANAYKNSRGSILIRIPDSDLTGDIFVTDNNGRLLLNPKYILGFVPVDDKHHIDTIIRPQQIISKRRANASGGDQSVLSNNFYSSEPIVDETAKKI